MDAILGEQKRKYLSKYLRTQKTSSVEKTEEWRGEGRKRRQKEKEKEGKVNRGWLTPDN